jgi:hypothetical protein
MAKQTFTTGQVLTAAQMTSLQQTAMGGGSTTAKTTSYVLVAADAGTVVQMNAAGATTITVNTALFAAGDSVQIQNIGAGVLTVTAGTATVTTAGSLALSQWEGGQLYFTAASSAIFFDIVQSSGMTNPMTATGDTIYSSSGSTPAALAIGTTGQILTVAAGLPSWASATTGSITLLSTTTLSGTSTTISSISQSYKNLVFIIRNLAVSATCSVSFQANGNNNSGFFTGKFYDTQVNQADISMNPDGNGATVGTNFTMGGVIQINNYTDTATGSWKPAFGNGVFYTTTPGAKAAWAQAGGWYTANAISSMKFATSGAQTLTGTILTYGVN